MNNDLFDELVESVKEGASILKKKKKKKTVIVEHRYTNAETLRFFPLWGNWNKWRAYYTEKAANEAIEKLSKKYKFVEFRIRHEIKNCKHCNRIAISTERNGGWSVDCYYSDLFVAVVENENWCTAYELGLPKLFKTEAQTIEEWNRRN